MPQETTHVGNAYCLPLGAELIIGKRRWKLVHRMKNHPDIMRFRETTAGESDPMHRGMYPSEVQAMIDKGFTVNLNSGKWGINTGK